MNEKTEIERQEEKVKEIANELFSFEPKVQATILKQVKDILLKRILEDCERIKNDMLTNEADKQYFSQ